MALSKIVIVEDEIAILEGVCAALRAAGYDPISTSDGEAGLAAAVRPGVELVLLDLMLPKMDGMSVLRELRKTHASLPVIILSARGAEDDRVGGLRGGADDYMVKPFSARELIARVEAVLRRSPERPTAVKNLRIDDATVDFDRREVSSPRGKTQSLSETECAILTHLAANPGRAVSRDELLSRLWGLSGAGIETRTVDMHVARLRAKLSSVSDHTTQDLILTVRGKGYMLGPGIKVIDTAKQDGKAGIQT